MESFAAGVPVIGSRMGGITEMVSHGVNGMLVPEGDLPAWREAVTRLLDDRYASELGENARIEWENKYSPTKALQALEVAYSSVLQRPDTLKATKARKPPIRTDGASLMLGARFLARHPGLKYRVAVPLYRGVSRSVPSGHPPRPSLRRELPQGRYAPGREGVDELPRMRHSGLHRAISRYSSEIPNAGETDAALVHGDLRRVRLGQYMTAHFPADPKVVAVLRELEYSTIVVLRDPRDIVVSAAHYIAAQPTTTCTVTSPPWDQTTDASWR